MPKECVFYEWKGGSFYCNVAQRDINDEIVHRYCWTLDVLLGRMSAEKKERRMVKGGKDNGKRRLVQV